MDIDWSQIAQAIPAIAKYIFNQNQPNPAGDMDKSAQQAQDVISKNLTPWVQTGLDQLPQYKENIQKLLSNPGQFINDVGKNYQQSPGLQFQINQGTQAANNAAAAGGMAGSPQNQQYGAEIAGNLANKDYYNYLSTALAEYGLGMDASGNLIKGGQQAATSLGEDTASIINNQAIAKYLATLNQNNSNSSGFDSLFSGLGSIAKGIFNF